MTHRFSDVRLHSISILQSVVVRTWEIPATHTHKLMLRITVTHTVEWQWCQTLQQRQHRGSKTNLILYHQLTHHTPPLLQQTAAFSAQRHNNTKCSKIHTNANTFTHHKKHTPAACMWVITTGLSTLYYQSISLSGSWTHASVMTCCYGITVPQLFWLAANLVCWEEEIQELPDAFCTMLPSVPRSLFVRK